MNLDELEEALIKALVSVTDISLTRIEAICILETFRLGKEKFKEKYHIFFLEPGK